MNWPENTEEQRERTATVIAWIVESLGEDAASTWAWECTPMPCWLPSNEQLDEGLRIATGELKLGDHLARCYAEMAEQSRAAAQLAAQAPGDTRPKEIK